MERVQPTHPQVSSMHGAKRRARRFTTSLLASFLCMFAALAATSVSSASAATLPPQGIFENCELDSAMSTCIQRLETMHSGGLQVVAISAGTTSLSSLQTYAAAAHAMGMSVLWEISNPVWWQEPATGTGADQQFSAFSTACGCTANGEVLASMIHWLAALPGTYGYYAADDSMLSPGDQAQVSTYVSEIKQQDSAHPVLVSSADISQAQQYAAIPDDITQEIYPVTTSSLLPVGSNQGIWSGVGQTAADAQQLADSHGKQSAFILQAFTWGDNLSDGQTIGACSAADSQQSCYAKLRYPAAGEQLQLRNEVLQHAHPQLILWWSFFGTYGQQGNDTYSIYPTGSVAAQRWAGLEQAIGAPAPTGHAVAHAAADGRHHKRHSRRHRKHRRRHHTNRLTAHLA